MSIRVTTMIIDAHCHLVRIKGYERTPGLLPVTVGYSHATNVKTVEIARKLGVPFVLGIAPQTALGDDLSKLGVWADFIRESAPNAVGEIGLDYHWAKGEQDMEKEKLVYARMLDLAEGMKLPIVIHARKAGGEVLDFLSLREWKLPFMLHFFSGSLHDAKRAVSMGGLISIPPVRSKERESVIKALPLDKLLVESDAPYVGRTPEATRDAVRYIAELKGVPEQEVEMRTAENAARFFGIEI